MLTPFTDLLKNCFNIKGRVDRRSYWSAILTYLVILFVLIWFGEQVPALSIIPKIFAVVIAIPLFTGGVRRLHDIGRSGYWIFLLLLPAIGWMCLFIYFCFPSASETEMKQRKMKKDNKRKGRDL